jgi:GntR family transcriptional regulator
MNNIKGLRLDKGIPMPLYEQLRQGLLAAIMDGTIPTGSKMPTEEELCEAYGISRPVVRQAYKALIESGHVERRRGAGTFVRSSNSRGRFIDKQLSYKEEMAVLGFTHKTVLLKKEWLDAKEVFCGTNIPYSGRVFRLVRMRYAEEKPFVLVENYIPESVFPDIDTYDFEQNSLYETMEREYGEHVVRSHRKIAAILADCLIAEKLEIKENAPVMYVENLVFDQYERAIDLSREYLDGETKTFEFEVFNS